MITETTVQVVGPDLVEISEFGETYRMSKADVEKAIENVKANRRKYASDVAYLKRLNHFEGILEAFQRRV